MVNFSQKSEPHSTIEQSDYYCRFVLRAVDPARASALSGNLYGFARNGAPSSAEFWRAQGWAPRPAQRETQAQYRSGGPRSSRRKT